jgi:hypothetical protein
MILRDRVGADPDKTLPALSGTGFTVETTVLRGRDPELRGSSTIVGVATYFVSLFYGVFS